MAPDIAETDTREMRAKNTSLDVPSIRVNVEYKQDEVV